MDPKEKHSRKNPVENANFFNILCFGWTAPIFWKSSWRDLHVTDLYDPLKSDESERLGDRLEREWKKELAKANQMGKDGRLTSGRPPNLMWAIIRMFWVPYMVTGLLLLVQLSVLRLIHPILQGLIINYFDEDRSLKNKHQVLVYAGCLVILQFVLILITHHTVLYNRRIGMCIRVACCSVLYRKIMRLNRAAATDAAMGRVTNLMSNDVARFDVVPSLLHYIWIMPIQVSSIGYIMWKTVGVAALVGIGAIMTQTIPVQGYLSSLSKKLRAKIAARTDERVQLMSEILSGIQVLKMYSWEKPFESIASRIRVTEMKFIGYMSYLKGFQVSAMVLSEKISLSLTLITFVLVGNTLTATSTFILVGLFALLQKTCNVCFPQAIVVASEASVSLERITAFLLLDEVESLEQVEPIANNWLPDIEDTETRQRIECQVVIEMVKVTANWVHGQLPPTLYEVSMEIKSQSLCTLVGPVGSGKSSLLHVVLGELPVQSGKLSIFTDENSDTKNTARDIRISYASQDPWLFSATIRDNILFGQPYNETRYQKVTRACALCTDFEQLPRGDLSFVGERGATLSGGQKARVNLARAVYRDADLYLLDDPLSAVDARVGRHLFEECIVGFLKHKTRILVTHQQQYLPQADTVVVLHRGTVKCQGTYHELVKENFQILDSWLLGRAKLEGTEKNLEDESECERTVVAVDGKDQQRKVLKISKRSKDVKEEKVATGNISKKVYQAYFLAGGNICSLSLLAIFFIAGQVVIIGTDYWVTYWTNQETFRAKLQSNKSTAQNTSFQNNTEDGYQEMWSSGSQWFDENGVMYRNLGIYVYVAGLIGCIFLVTLRSVLFTRMCNQASRKIHDSVFANLLRAKMRFFNTNPSGRILNRFTKDMGAMDELLPMTMFETLIILIMIMGIFTLIILANNWMILPIVIMCGLFYGVGSFYINTARDIKRLEAITKSPMFSHANSTLDGLATIRSRGALAEELLRKEFDRYQDAHTGAWYLNIATATAFGFFLDLISCLFIACVIFSLILMDAGDTLGGYVGLAISQSLILTNTVQYGVRQSTEMISQMTAVERILQYNDLPVEGPFLTDNSPPPEWPAQGGLIFKNVSMKYADDKPDVLKNLNLTIKPGWKIGIVGRTGAGKSSLISALFRLTGDGLEGQIIVDGIDTKSIGLHEVRPRISIIPQEPILFSGSLRHNLDLFEQYSDAELWDSLREVELGNALSSLDVKLSGGANFSVGQRQLICLARAILRKNRILVLDEATANVDHDTDALIQKTIRRRFADCTVLTIAHRLNTLMDSDRVLFLKHGCIVEFGHPHLLLKNQDGHFSRMLQQTGKTIAAKLSKIAESSFLLSLEREKNSDQLPSLSLPEQNRNL